MKFWSSEYTFNHPWETVTTAVWQKYPNPLNPNVVGLDVVNRSIEQGVLKSHRLLSTEWGVPSWVTKFIGMNDKCLVSESSEVDPRKKIMKLNSRNLTLCNIINVEECLQYEQHPEDPTRTKLTQSSRILVQNIPLTAYLESCVVNTCTSNANKGRQAMEWVIDNLNTSRLKQIAQESIDTMSDLTPPRVAHCQTDDPKPAS